MAEIKTLSLLSFPAQHSAICRWQTFTGSMVEHHYGLPSLSRSVKTDEKLKRHIIVLLGWDSNNPQRSAKLIAKTKKQLDHQSHIVVICDHDNEQAIVTAINLGADRVIRADQPTRIFAAQIDAIVRRMGPGNHLQHFPPYQMNQMTREVYVEDQRIQLTPREFHLAQYLFENRNSIVTRASLLRDIWGLPELQYNRRVDTKISHIRRKMGLDGTYGWLLKFPRGKGYQLLSVPLATS